VDGPGNKKLKKKKNKEVEEVETDYGGVWTSSQTGASLGGDIGSEALEEVVVPADVQRRKDKTVNRKRFASREWEKGNKRGQVFVLGRGEKDAMWETRTTEESGLLGQKPTGKKNVRIWGSQARA